MRDFKLKRLEPDRLTLSWAMTGVAITLLLALFVAITIQRSYAQNLQLPAKVSNVSSQISDNGSLVTIAADKSLSRPQTWQDEEGFHVVFPNTISNDKLKPGRGVKVRRLGSSLEVLAHTKPGARVSLSSANNQLSLIIDGKLEPRDTESTFRAALTNDEKRLFQDEMKAQVNTAPIKVPTIPPSDTATSVAQAVPEIAQQPTTTAAPASQTMDPGATKPAQIVAQSDDTIAPAIKVQTEDESVLSSVFSGTGVLVVFALGMFGFLISRKVRSRQQTISTKAVAEEWEDAEPVKSNDQSPVQNNSNALVKVGDTIPARQSKNAVQRTAVAGPTSLYGAYRIDQEVGKLILGQPHRIDVMASRAIDDRRAIETSLIKGLAGGDENGQRRAREALEEYGFVARLCAALLLAPDAFERTSAARALGEIKSPTALPFLLESLYDSEPIVRNEAVMSIGELKIPSAIGALLDIARTHPDVPSALLSRTLSACSVEGLDFFDAEISDPALLAAGDVGLVVMEIDHLEHAAPIECLPADSDDEFLRNALVAVSSGNVEERSEALKILVQFRVQSAVDAIAGLARRDPESTIRSQAISSLGTINHESVFSTVLMGMADESREVRAAAARSINRLSFDRADAYARVIESSDDETLRSVAKACIQAGIVSQNLDRLTYADHRQAYETFSLVCLLTKAGMNEPILDAIAEHPRSDVRLKVIHFLACTEQAQVVDQLRELAVRDGMGEVVKTALLEAIYKLDQNNRAAGDEIRPEGFTTPSFAEVLETEENPALTPDEFDIAFRAFEGGAHPEAEQYEV